MKKSLVFVFFFALCLQVNAAKDTHQCESLQLLNSNVKNSMVKFSQSYIDEQCSLTNGYKRLCFKARDNNKIKIFFVQYGSDIPTKDLYNTSHRMVEKLNSKLGSLFEFIHLGIMNVDFQVSDEQIKELRENHKIKDFDRGRLKRLYHYYKVKNRGVISDNVYNSLMKIPSVKSKLKQADLIFVFSNAQFEGLGYTIGNMTVLKYPTEIGWETSDGGRTELNFTNGLMSTGIHELGHGLGLKHSSHNCQKLNFSTPEAKACCKESPSKDDIMSYCRNRVSSDLEFGECSMKNLKEVTAKLLRTGGLFNYQDVQDCQ